MINITHKSGSHRRAVAQAVVTTGSADTLLAVKEGRVPKGNVLESARVAALFAVKRTHDMIPDCHPLPIEQCAVQFETGEKEIRILVEVQTVYKTGVEVEAMHGASVAALTIYDMLKPIDKQIEIGQIRLLEKSGGKSDYTDIPQGLRTAVVVCSDTISAGKKEDHAGKTIIGKLEKMGIQNEAYVIIPDSEEEIRRAAVQFRDNGIQLLIFCGGTGLSPRDITPEALSGLIDRPVPGIMEAARSYGQQRMPYAMLSRGVAGYSGKMFILAVPGSTRGAAETMDALFPYLLHIFRVAKGARHDQKQGD